jgi:hypothetical protein
VRRDHDRKPVCQGAEEAFGLAVFRNGPIRAFC